MSQARPWEQARAFCFRGALMAVCERGGGGRCVRVLLKRHYNHHHHRHHTTTLSVPPPKKSSSSDAVRVEHPCCKRLSGVYVECGKFAPPMHVLLLQLRHQSRTPHEVFMWLSYDTHNTLIYTHHDMGALKRLRASSIQKLKTRRDIAAAHFCMSCLMLLSVCLLVCRRLSWPCALSHPELRV